MWYVHDTYGFLDFDIDLGMKYRRLEISNLPIHTRALGHANPYRCGRPGVNW
jgi:hypothetical protein